ncbi:MAG: RraA family protein [Candidatus Pacebacteria bacterium]|nr:RraA family protein [Candidatus Paceibacterota bacterium]
MDILSELKKLSLAALSDALDQLNIDGGCKGIFPRSKNKVIVGKAFTVKFSKVSPGTFAKAADYIDKVKPGEVIVIDNEGRDYCTVWGEILTQVAMYKKLVGTVIDGACRDIETVAKSNYPVFSKYVFMKTGKNRVKLAFVQKPIVVSGIRVNPGDYIRGDESGILVISAGKVEATITKAKEIEANERKILTAIKQGVPLKKARITFSYNFKPPKNENR